MNRLSPQSLVKHALERLRGVQEIWDTYGQDWLVEELGAIANLLDLAISLVMVRQAKKTET